MRCCVSHQTVLFPKDIHLICLFSIFVFPGLDRAVLQSMSLVADGSGASSSKAKPQLSNKQIEKLLREGAYAMFAEGGEEEEQRAKQFAADDIDQILSRATKIVHKDDESGGSNDAAVGAMDGVDAKSTFSKVCFLIHVIFSLFIIFSFINRFFLIIFVILVSSGCICGQQT